MASDLGCGPIAFSVCSCQMDTSGPCSSSAGSNRHRPGDLQLRAIRSNAEIGKSRAGKTTRAVSLKLVTTDVYFDRMRLVRGGVLDGGSNRIGSPTNPQGSLS